MMWGAGSGPWLPVSVLGALLVVALAVLTVRMLWWALPRGRLRPHGRLAIPRAPGDGGAIAPSSPPGNVRVSNAERDEVIEQLRRHAGEGRLTLDEFEARAGEATEAKTVSQLRGVLRDLPVLPAPGRRRR